MALFEIAKKWTLVKKFFREIDLFDFMVFFGLDPDYSIHFFPNQILDTQTQQLSNLVKIHNDSLQILRIIKDESRKFKWQPLIPSIIFFFQGGGGRSCGCSINNAEERFNVMNFSTVC